MRYRIALSLAVIGLFIACAAKTLPPVVFNIPTRHMLERVYYALVAGFDVYGTAGHQLALRLYMDQLRVEGESYFLDFLPAVQETRNHAIVV